MKDLADVKIKQVSEDGSRKIANFKQEIDQQLRLANDNLIKSEEKTKEIL
jgi:BMFP domain-containing protein YqiC